MLQQKTVKKSTLELLKQLMLIPELQDFFLVGGTNLSLKLGHRISIDLDLFTDKRFDAFKLHDTLQKYYPDMIVTLNNQTTLLCYIKGIKVDFVLYEYGLINPIEEHEGVRFASIPDIVAMKLNAISRRGVKKDYWDVAELLNLYSIDEMISFFKEKHKTTDVGQIIRSLVYFDDADESDTPKSLKKVTWKAVKETIKTKIKEYIKQQIK